jgi:hypothetical protein
MDPGNEFIELHLVTLESLTNAVRGSDLSHSVLLPEPTLSKSVTQQSLSKMELFDIHD